MIIQIVDRAPAIELSDLPFNITGSSFLFSKRDILLYQEERKRIEEPPDRRLAMWPNWPN